MNRIERLYANWVYGGFVFSFLLLALLLAAAPSFSLELSLIAAHLPLYMWHQYEEHDADRFREFCDENFGKGVLDRASIFFINVLGAWALFTALILLATHWSLGLGLGIVYLTLFNGISHLLMGIRSRTYNPGLFTAAVLFVPLSLSTLGVLRLNPTVSVLHHTLGIVAGIGVHLAIVAFVVYRRIKQKPA